MFSVILLDFFGNCNKTIIIALIDLWRFEYTFKFSRVWE